ALVYFSAPLIGKFYNQEILIAILRVYAISFVIRSFVAVHVAKLTKEMNFKLQMKLQVPSTIIGAVVGVCLAYLGYGVWSLVWLNLTQTIVFTLQNWMFIKCKPFFLSHKRRIQYHFNWGDMIFFSGLLVTVHRDTDNTGFRITFCSGTVGSYSQAQR